MELTLCEDRTWRSSRDKASA